MPQFAAGVVEEANNEWALDVRTYLPNRTHSPSSKRRVASYYKDGLGWSWIGNPLSEEWCGAFAAWCARAAIPEHVRFKSMASCWRLERLRKLARWPTIQEAAAGDIVTVNGSSRGYGSHICVVVRTPTVAGQGMLTCIEGNALGAGPGGNVRPGVGLVLRPWTDIRRVYPLQALAQAPPIE